MTDGPRSRMRTVGPDDYLALRVLALAWFPADTLLPAKTYRTLIESGAIIARALEVQGAMAGYFALWSLTASAYARLKCGQLAESDLGVDDIVCAEDARAAVLYISDICVSRGQTGVVLLRDLRRCVTSLLRAHHHIAVVAAWAFTIKGARIANDVGLGAAAGVDGLVEISAAELLARIGR